MRGCSVKIAYIGEAGSFNRELGLPAPECERRSNVLRKWLKRALLAFAVCVALLAFACAATQQGRTATRTALFLPQVVPTFPVKPQEWVSAQPSVEEVRFQTAAGSGVADLYLPAGDGVHPGVLLFLGVNPAGRDDPRVVGLAEGLARSGAAVMIPWSDTMTQKRVSPDEIDSLVRAYGFLLAHERVDPGRSGMGGFCVGASFAAVAAQDARIREDVRFVNFFGGYYDARDLAASVVSRSRFYGDDSEPWTPDRLSVEVVSAHLIEGLPDADERALLERVFISEDAVIGDAALASMSAEARAVHRLLSGTSLGEARELVNSLPEPMLDKLAAISPATRIEDLRARVLIMHDREDELVPSEESRRLAGALAERGDFYHTEFSLFQHVDPTASVSPPVYAREIFKLYLHMYNVLRQMD